MSTRKGNTQKGKRDRSASPRDRSPNAAVENEMENEMENERVEVKQSLNPAFGLGLFAKRKFTKNSFIADLRGVFMTEEDYAKLPADRKGKAIGWDPEEAIENVLERVNGSRFNKKKLDYELFKFASNFNRAIKEDWENDMFDEDNEDALMEYFTRWNDVIDIFREEDKDLTSVRHFLAFLNLLRDFFPPIVMDTSDTHSLGKYANDPKNDTFDRKANAILVFSLDSTYFELRALKTIQPGDEILIDYGDDYFVDDE